MKIETFDDQESTRDIGAVVLKLLRNGEIQVDLGPADGVPIVRLHMTRDEAFELGSALHGLDGERVILTEE